MRVTTAGTADGPLDDVDCRANGCGNTSVRANITPVSARSAYRRAWQYAVTRALDDAYVPVVYGVR